MFGISVFDAKGVAFSTPKASNVIAQGNALGFDEREIPKPQRGAMGTMLCTPIIAPRWGF